MAHMKIAIKDIKRYIGREIGVSDWIDISQERVNLFAEATGDFQWVHVDEKRARTELSDGKTIAHNFLLLSMIPQLFDQVVSITGLRYGLNKGGERVRFIKPVSTGSRIRARIGLNKLEYVDQTGMTATFHILMELDGGEKPVLSMDLQLLLVAG
ncbi:MaoC family dehydratase [Paremcibacter congregatus]|tara:strand:- start:10789 stop:11253 length:465 start_codon:yes stop_codon:yes gene_type:complete